MKKLILIIIIANAVTAYGQGYGSAAMMRHNDSVYRAQYVDNWKWLEYLSADDKKAMANLKMKDSVLYNAAIAAYEASPKKQNAVEFVKLFMLHDAWRKEDEKTEADRIKQLKKKYGPAVAKKLLEQKVWIGMTDKMVIDEFGWAVVKRSVSSKGVIETWYYLEDNPHCVGKGCPVLDYSLTFKNHKVIAINDL